MERELFEPTLETYKRSLNITRNNCMTKKISWNQAPVAYSIILATWEAEIRRIMIQSQPGKIAGDTLSQKNLSQKKVQ
jgi:hypothetical protein